MSTKHAPRIRRDTSDCQHMRGGRRRKTRKNTFSREQRVAVGPEEPATGYQQCQPDPYTHTILVLAGWANGFCRAAYHTRSRIVIFGQLITFAIPPRSPSCRCCASRNGNSTSFPIHHTRHNKRENEKKGTIMGCFRQSTIERVAKELISKKLILL